MHFTMEDNPSLTEAIRQRYQRLYTGVFYLLFSGLLTMLFNRLEKKLNYFRG